MNEVTYYIEFADNGMIVRSDLTTVVEGNERRMSEEIGKLVYAEMTQLMGETNKIKLTIKVEKG
jgi:ribosomal protein S1